MVGGPDGSVWARFGAFALARAIAAARSGTLIGLPTKSSMPPARQVSRSVAKTFAVMATIGMDLPLPNARMAAVASSPFMRGICMSMKIRS